MTKTFEINIEDLTYEATERFYIDFLGCKNATEILEHTEYDNKPIAIIEKEEVADIELFPKQTPPSNSFTEKEGDEKVY